MFLNIFVKMNKIVQILIGWLLLHPFWIGAQFYYGLYQQYGRNRVQYNTFEWGFYRFERLDIYTYADNDILPHAVANMAHLHLREIEAVLDVAFDERFQILVFNTLGDLKQSNNNLDINQPDNGTRVNRFLDRNTILIYFDGNIQNLEREIKAGIAEQLIRYQIYGDLSGGGLEVYRAQFPDWFVQGLVSYFAHGDDPLFNWEIIRIHSERRFRRINSLEPDLARLAGHGIWSYIVSTYGRNVIKNILFTSIVHKSMDFGIEYVLGITTKELIQRWNEYTGTMHREIASAKTTSDTEKIRKFRKKERIADLEYSAMLNKLGVTTTRNGKKAVYVVNPDNGNKKKIFKSGALSYERDDLQTPLISWHPTLPILVIIDEKAGFNRLHFYDFEERKRITKMLYGITKVYSVAYSPDGEKLIFSAMKEGKSDVIEYTIRNTGLKKVTSDIHSDLSPVYVSGNRWISVLTTRKDNSLESKSNWKRNQDNLNIQFIDLHNPDKPALILESSNAHGRPLKYDSGKILYAEYDSDLFTTFYSANLDSAISFVDTIVHYRYLFQKNPVLVIPGIVNQYSIAEDSMKIYFTSFRNNQQVLFRKYLTIADLVRRKPDLQPTKKENPTALYSLIESSDRRIPDNEININDYQFDSRLLEKYRYSPRQQTQQLTAPSAISVPGRLNILKPLPEHEDIKLPPRRPYLLSFYRENISFHLDNAFLVPQYQPFTGKPQPFLINPQFNGMMKVGIADVMRDYRLIAGLRAELNPLAGRSLAPNHEIVLWLGNHKKRWKHEYTFYRRSSIQTGGVPVWNRFLTHEIQYKTIYPIDEVRSVHLHPSYRLDSRITLARDAVSLALPTDYQHFGIIRASYVHDETLPLGVNLWRGFRIKFFTEYYRNLYNSRSGLHTAGMDARYYIPVWRSSVWANRLAVGTSFGPERLIYFLGGVDNAFVPRFDENTPIAESQNYIFQTLVTNMRGFYQNARNGNSFTVINSELRLPVFRMMLNRPIKNAFLNSMQIVLFGDLGTAWNGISPLSPENAINQKIIDKGNLRIVIDSRKDPLIGGFGFGLRMMLFGHLVRVDWAKGIEDYTILPRVFHVSLGLDF